MDHLEALNALDAKRGAEAQMAKAAHCPPWRHAIFGAIMAALVASPAFDFPVRTGILVAVLACIPIIIRSDRKRMGMFINGYRRGRTRWVTFGLLALWLPIYVLATYYALELHERRMPLILSALTFALATGGSIIWQRVFVREMGA